MATIGLARLLQSDPRFMPAPFTPVPTPGTTDSGEASPAASSNPNAPSLNLASQTQGPVDAAMQGATQALSDTNMSGRVGDAIGLPASGLTTPSGLVGTAGRTGLAILAGMVPGYNTMQGLTSLFAGPLGFLSGLGTFYGMQGQDTGPNAGMSQDAVNSLVGIAPGSSDSAAGKISQGLGITAGQLASMNSEAPFGQSLGTRGLSPTLSDALRGADMTIPTNPRGNDDGNTPDGPAAPGTPGSGVGPGGGVGASPDGGLGDGNGPGASSDGVAGDSGVWHTGGTVRGKRGQEVRGRLKAGEEVVQESEASKPGVRAALKDINRPGTSPLESGLGRLLRRR